MIFSTNQATDIARGRHVNSGCVHHLRFGSLYSIANQRSRVTTPAVTQTAFSPPAKLRILVHHLRRAFGLAAGCVHHFGFGFLYLIANHHQSRFKSSHHCTEGISPSSKQQISLELRRRLNGACIIYNLSLIL